jgi:DNA repair protein RadA/Sms
LAEPAADLAILAAMASSLTDTALDPHTVVIGEVGLVGEIRAVSQPLPRLKEAARHGFRRAIVPLAMAQHAVPGLQVIGVRDLREALTALLPAPRGRRDRSAD